ncbi:MAG: cation diffusion facilitator family transporter [Bacillus sp. (in: firmicutes)]
MGEQKETRFKQAENAAVLGIVVNIVLTVVKLIAGIIGNSKALIADSVHSGSDVVGSFAVYVGLKAAKKAPDEEHPYGHGKAESVAAIIVAVLLVFAGVKIGLSSFEAFLVPPQVPKPLALYVIVFSIVVKEALFRYKFRLGKKLESQALIVNAYEHRSDVYSSVAALFGVGAALVGKYAGIEWLAFGDPIAGLLVSLMVLRIAYTLGKDSIYTTLDQVLPENETAPFREIVQGIPGVEKMNTLLARKHGHYVIIDLKIAVKPDLTVEEGHRIGKKVKRALLKKQGVQDVFVHINPLGEEE